MKEKLIKLLGGYYEYEVQCTDTQGCYRKWTDGLSTLESALESMQYSIDNGQRWNPHRDSEWRVEKKLSFSKYYKS